MSVSFGRRWKMDTISHSQGFASNVCVGVRACVREGWPETGTCSHLPCGLSLSFAESNLTEQAYRRTVFWCTRRG